MSSRRGTTTCKWGTSQSAPITSLLAFALDTDGSETYTLRVKDLASGDLLPDHVENTYYGWNGATTIARSTYTSLDPPCVHTSCTGTIWVTPPPLTRVVYHEDDERFFLRLYKAKSDRYIFLALGSAVTSEVYAIDADQRDGQPILVQPRVQDMEYFVTHHRNSTGDERFLILTNWEAENFR